MQSELKREERLVPLRRFAHEDLYSTAYLSLLVQRGKLKARKIGRNYFTTELWFREYLRRHAKDEIRAGYARALEREDQSIDRRIVGKKNENKRNIDFNIYLNNDGSAEAGGVLLRLKKGFYRLAVVFTGLLALVLLGMNLFLSLDRREPRVLGADDIADEKSSSTEAIIDLGN